MLRKTGHTPIIILFFLFLTACGNSEINDSDVKLTANAGKNHSLDVGSVATLDATSSRGLDITGYHWKITKKPTNSQAEIDAPNSLKTQFTLDSIGQYEVELVVANEKESSSPDYITISALGAGDSVPIANAGDNQSIQAGELLTLNGSGTSPTGKALNYHWSIASKPNNTLPSLNAETSAKPELTFYKDGDYIVQLIVDDGDFQSQPNRRKISVSGQVCSSAQVDFNENVWPVLEGQCIDCHRQGGQSTPFNLVDETVFDYLSKNFELFKNVAQKKDASGNSIVLSMPTFMNKSHGGGQVIKIDEPDYAVLEKIIDYLDDCLDAPSNLTPILADISDQSIVSSKTTTLDIFATDPDGNEIILSAIDLPSFAQLSDNGNGRGVINFQPNIDDAGSYLITVVASDGKVQDNLSVNVSVFSDNAELPLAINEPDSITVDATDDLTPVRIGSATANGGTAPRVISNNAPADNFFPIGISEITWVVTDANGNIASQSQTITVKPLNNEACDPIKPAFHTNTWPVLAVNCVSCHGTGENRPFMLVNEINNNQNFSTFKTNALKKDALGKSLILSKALNSDDSHAAGEIIQENTAAYITLAGTVAQLESCSRELSDADQLTIEAPADISQIATGEFTAISLGTATINGGITPITQNNNAPTNNQFPPGNSIVTWTASDAAGTQISDTQIITITAVTESCNSLKAEFHQTTWPALKNSCVNCHRVGGNNSLFNLIEEDDNDNNFYHFKEMAQLKNGETQSSILSNAANLNGEHSPGAILTTNDADYATLADMVNRLSNCTQAPVVASINDQSLQFGDTANIDISASDVNGDTMLMSVENLPEFATFNVTGNGTATITLAPLANDIGNYTVTVTVSDGGSQDSQSFDINVSNRTPLSLTVAQSITLKATGPLTFVSLTDSVAAGGTPPYSYDNNVPTGNQFSAGETKIIWKVTDSQQVSVSEVQTITVINDTAETCMVCHNGSKYNDYAGEGMKNPHPFPGASSIRCTVCHGGNGSGSGKTGSHVPPPYEIGDGLRQLLDPIAYFNRLTLTGIDKFPDYTVNGVRYTGLDYLQFINPGDLRVSTESRGCGYCHQKHTEWVSRDIKATGTGVLSGGSYIMGIENSVADNQDLYEDTAADFAFRAIENPDYTGYDANKIGAVGSLIEFPVFSVFNQLGGANLFQNNNYDANNLENDLQADNSVRANSALANLYHSQEDATCGDCHLGSAGANNRYGDFRSSGCSACHMPYSPDGRSTSSDPNINRTEPINPDAIAAPERPHIREHVIQNIAKTLPTGEKIKGIDDQTCAGCHQGSNRTVMQYWGIRLDQNQDLTNNTQYPANPESFVDTAIDERLFSSIALNQTYNGRIAAQYIQIEDYDGDSRDDTPPDVHYDAGMGCIDCHGSRDLHGGANTDATGGEIRSRMDQIVAIRCESCHGTIGDYAETASCTTSTGIAAECAKDSKGNILNNVFKYNDQPLTLVSRVNGKSLYVSQTKDAVVDSGVIHPKTGKPIYSANASYAMGRADGNIATGIGPQQNDTGLVTNGFSHTDELKCETCHSSWTNGCYGCHLAGEYNDDPNNFFVSNITGERIVFNEANADFIYQTPVPFQLGVDSSNKIALLSPNTASFFRYTDLNGNESKVFAFSDRNGNGNNPGVAGRGNFPALAHNSMLSHSIRGKVDNANEGPKYCVACHLTEKGMNDFGDQYDVFREALANDNFDQLDFNLLQEHIGKNPGNQLNSPLWVHMISGLGSGLFLMDENGCPVNPLDNNANRQYCQDGAPADNFDPNNVVYNLDRIVEETGVSNTSNSHPMLKPGEGKNKRDGALNPNMSGPLGAILVNRLSDPNNGVVLDSWFDADGQAQGGAATIIANNIGLSQNDLQFEAESGTVAEPMEVQNDAAASADQYIVLPQGENTGVVTYNFNITTSGNYVIWGKTAAIAGTGDSFFVSVDGGNDTIWDVDQNNVWVWNQVSDRNGNDPIVYSLAAGAHTLEIKGREANTKLDSIIITSNLAFQP